MVDSNFFVPVGSRQERFYFRFLGGPQNRLTWALDPEHGNDWASVLNLKRMPIINRCTRQIAPTDTKNIWKDEKKCIGSTDDV